MRLADGPDRPAIVLVDAVRPARRSGEMRAIGEKDATRGWGWVCFGFAVSISGAASVAILRPSAATAKVHLGENAQASVIGLELMTARLRLRPWRPEDAEPMAAINRDPEVTRYLNRPVDEEAVEAFFGLVIEDWSAYGFGFWAIELRQPEPTFIGFAGIAYPTFLAELADRPELGWRLTRTAWGHGYATEAATAARDDGLGRLELAELISIIHPRNLRSQRLASRLGMARERQVFNPVLNRQTDVWRIAA